MFCNIFVALKCVRTSSTLFDAKRSPLKTSVPKTTARSDGILRVNLIVAWNRLAKSTKLLIVINEHFPDDMFVRARKE